MTERIETDQRPKRARATSIDPTPPSSSSFSPFKRLRIDRIPNGTYQVLNLATGAYAGLLDDNNRSEVVNVILGLDHELDQGGIQGSNWLIEHVRLDRYTIQHRKFQSYASYDPLPNLGDRVVGKWDVPKEWTIRVVASPNVVTIAPTENPDLLCMSTYGPHGTPLEYGKSIEDRLCHWAIRAVGSTPDLQLQTASTNLSARERAEIEGYLMPSKIADHKYYPEGDKGMLRRTVCTNGTRVGLLNDIAAWARNQTAESPSVYWLFGLAGSGKSTIAYTVARRFASDIDRTVILGGNFFCSRQFPETRQSKWIIRTIAYHLALVFRPFADALNRSGNFHTVDQGVEDQIQNLLVEPWRQVSLHEYRLRFLVIIDALDEIDGEGGSEFLRALFNVLNEGHLHGLVFFATSRPDPALVARVNNFERKHLYRLEDVRKEEVQADIDTYLTSELPHLAGRVEMGKLVTLADGLFIWAATVVRYLRDYGPSEQEEVLKPLLSNPHSMIPKGSDADSPSLDELYHRILVKAFPRMDEITRKRRLLILYTFLCTAERTSVTVVVDILCQAEKRGLYIDSASEVLKKLHAVLYIEDGKVLSYHRSFSDFLFEKSRSIEFFCDPAEQNRLLAESCFRVMNAGLRFNIASIPSSSIFDRDNSILSAEVERTIPAALRYSCRNWGRHLCSTLLTTSHHLCDTLSKFLQLQALFWIEAMNLLELGGRCDAMLRTLADFVRKLDPRLAVECTEAANFSVYFSGSPASLCTPQLYISALATWPRSSNPCQGWRGYFPGIPAVRNALEGGGSVRLMTMNLKAAVNAVAFSPDGSRIVSGSWDQRVRVWDASTGQSLKELEGHIGVVTSVSFSSDGSRIVSGSQDKTMRVWDASTGQSLNMLDGHIDLVTSVSFSPGGGRIVSGSQDKTVRVWDASTGHLLNVLGGHGDVVTSAAFSCDGSRIVSGSWDRTVRVWDALTGQSLNVLGGHANVITSVAFSPDGSHIASGSYYGTLRVWDASTGHLVKELRGHIGVVTSVSFSPDGGRIVSGSHDKTVRVWDASTGQSLNVLEGHVDIVISVTFSPDGSRIVSGSQDETVRVWDASTGPSLNVLDGHNDIVNSVAFSPDDSRIVSGSGDKTVRVWDALTGQSLTVLDGHIDIVTSVSFSPDGGRIVSGSQDKTLRVWIASTGKPLNVLDGHTNVVNSVAFSRDGNRIVSGSWDQTVRVWDALTGHSINVLDGHTNAITSVAFSPDGSHIVSGS